MHPSKRPRLEPVAKPCRNHDVCNGIPQTALIHDAISAERHNEIVQAILVFEERRVCNLAKENLQLKRDVKERDDRISRVRRSQLTFIEHMETENNKALALKKEVQSEKQKVEALERELRQTKEKLWDMYEKECEGSADEDDDDDEDDRGYEDEEDEREESEELKGDPHAAQFYEYMVSRALGERWKPRG